MLQLPSSRVRGLEGLRPESLVRRLGFIFGAWAMVFVGCSAVSNGGIATDPSLTPLGVFFPKQVPLPDPQTFPAALLEGKLLVIGQCLRVIATGSGTNYLLVWPSHFSLSTDQGRLVVLNGEGQSLYREGDPVRIGGGEIPSDESSWQNTPLLQQSVPKECPGPYWLVSPIVIPTSSSILQPPAIVTMTSTSFSEYTDKLLCFSVTVPAVWVVDGSPSGFAAFAPSLPGPEFRIVNAAVAEKPTLEQALEELTRGSLGPQIQSIENWAVDSQPALWVTLADSEFQFDLLVITPACADGQHALFVSANGTDRKSFEAFLDWIHFLR